MPDHAPFRVPAPHQPKSKLHKLNPVSRGTAQPPTSRAKGFRIPKEPIRLIRLIRPIIRIRPRTPHRTLNPVSFL